MRTARARHAWLAVLGIVGGCAASPVAAFRTNEGYVADLESADPEDRADALLALADRSRDDEGLRPTLAEKAARLADDEAVPVRLVALRILAQLACATTNAPGVHVVETAAILARHAEPADRDFWCRIEALDGLTAIVAVPTNVVVPDAARTAARDALLRAIQQDLEPDRDVRIHAARQLAALRLGGRPVLDRLVAALSDESHDVRAHALRALIAVAGDDHGPTKADWERWVKYSSESR